MGEEEATGRAGGTHQAVDEVNFVPAHQELGAVNTHMNTHTHKSCTKPHHCCI